MTASPEQTATRVADRSDAARIVDVLRSNAEETSLSQQPTALVRANIADFIVVDGPDGELLGCTQIHVHRPGYIEILAVAIHPNAQGQGVGGALMREAVKRAVAQEPRTLWLSTEKPDYFSRFGFVPFSMWKLPLPILVGKLRTVFRQRAERWIPTLFYRTVFMRYDL